MLARVAESTLKRDRVIVSVGLVVIVVLAWLYVLRLAESMAGAGMSTDMAITMAPSLTMPDFQPLRPETCSSSL